MAVSLGILVSQQALIVGLFAYPLAFKLITPHYATPLRIAASRELISIFHCTFITILALCCLQRELTPAILDPWRAATITGNPRPPKVVDSQLPIIATKSEFANAVTTLETGYLIQDSFILLYAWHNQRKNRSLPGKDDKVESTESHKLRGLNFQHLTIHHALLGGAFAILQFYIYNGWERGVLIITIMLLMNASSPFGAVRWFLINFCPEQRMTITIATVIYLAIFAMCRVYLIYWILQMFGLQQFGYGGLQGAWDTFWDLRPWCLLGTASLALVNTLWLLNGVIGVTKRLGGNLRKKKLN